MWHNTVQLTVGSPLRSIPTTSPSDDSMNSSASFTVSIATCTPFLRSMATKNLLGGSGGIPLRWWTITIFLFFISVIIHINIPQINKFEPTWHQYPRPHFYTDVWLSGQFQHNVSSSTLGGADRNRVNNCDKDSGSLSSKRPCLCSSPPVEYSSAPDIWRHLWQTPWWRLSPPAGGGRQKV